jgi:hypothetical protein
MTYSLSLRMAIVEGTEASEWGRGRRLTSTLAVPFLHAIDTCGVVLI